MDRWGNQRKDQWVWDAIAAGEVALAKSGEQVLNFGWTHPWYGSPLTSFLKNFITEKQKFDCPVDKRKEIASELIEWLMLHGAKPDTIVPDGVPTEEIYSKGKGKGKPSVIKFEFAGEPASTGIMNLRLQFQQSDSAFKPNQVAVELLDHVLEVIAANAQRTPTIRIPEAIADLWDRVSQRAKQEGDVTIISSDASSSKAHKMFLEEASPVLKAMLRTPMKEGRGVGSTSAQCCHEISVDEPGSVVEAFVSLLYTGAFFSENDEGPGVSVLLGVFRLCHLWQVQNLVDLLEIRLMREVLPENLEMLLEAAILHGAQALKQKCIRIALEDSAVREQTERGEFKPAVLAELRLAMFPAESKPQKRRRQDF